MRVVGYNNISPPARPIPRSKFPTPSHETRLWKKATKQELFLEEAHRKDTIRLHSTILMANRPVTKDNRSLFTSKPTDIYKSKKQVQTEQENIMREAKAARKALRQQQANKTALKKKQQNANSNKPTDAEEEASVHP
jgi:hypothetical protein